MSGAWSLPLLQKHPGKSEPRSLSHECVPSSGIVEAGDFRLDIAGRVAQLCGRDLPLTSEEFDVLVFLTSHTQRLVTPHTVLATNWSANQLHQTEFLKVLLSLRKKLEALGSGKQYLRTEPWVVYRFDSSPLASF
jgi:two-component system, OmpR family, KDP operon response regulator KdpE